eukprot:1161616-Pelagomonas_calceolata.AAC.1
MSALDLHYAHVVLAAGMSFGLAPPALARLQLMLALSQHPTWNRDARGGTKCVKTSLVSASMPFNVSPSPRKPYPL